MTELDKRLASLTPKQRELLALRMKKSNPGVASKTPAVSTQPQNSQRKPGKTKMDFTLFFFSDDGTANQDDKYGLLMEAAQYADEAGFKAIWTPERHFQTFGGLYPNPAVLNAALAMKTKNVRLRAGSSVLPLSGPVRAAEDWSLVDNLSGGRVDVAFASGWHKFDYVMAPERFGERRAYMYRHIETVQQLWRGEQVTMPGVEGEPVTVRTYPRPIQPRLPYWLSCNSANTWLRAGEMGANVLTGIVTSMDDVIEHIKNYRKARMEHGHNPRTGVVSLMLHTYMGATNEEVYEKSKGPLAEYLKNFLDQFRMFMKDEMEQLGDEADLLRFAVERYFADSSLLGTHEKNAAMIEQLAGYGVNEIACLVDFGLSRQDVMTSLKRLNALREQFAT